MVGQLAHQSLDAVLVGTVADILFTPAEVETVTNADETLLLVRVAVLVGVLVRVT